MTKIVETKIKETKESEPDQVLLEGWLELQAANDAVKGVRVFKRNVLGKWARCYDMDIPFGDDLDTLFRTRGDGDYKFIAFGERGKVIGERTETVEGYGPGTVTKSVLSREDTDEAADTEMDEMLSMMRKNLRMSVLRKQIRESDEDNRPTDHDDDRLTMKEVLQLFAQMISAFRPQQDDTVKTLLPLLFNKVITSEPTDKMLDSFIKIVELQERMRGGGGGLEGADVPGWMQALLIGMNTPVGQNIARAIAMRAATPGAQSHPAMPPAPPETTPPPTPSPTPAESVATAGAEATGQPPDAIVGAYRLFQDKISPLLKAAARKGSKNFLAYGDLIDDHLPGFIDRWVSHERFEEAAQALANVDPEWTTDAVLTQWLAECWKTLKESEPEGNDT